MMGSVASELKSEREKRKISLSQIAAETRISLRHLESLEEGRFNDLPGGIYNKAFLKAYCEILNLDSREIMQRYEAEISPAPERLLKPRAHKHTSTYKISPFVIWTLMLLISAAGVFFSRKWIAAIFSPYFSHTSAVNVRHQPLQPEASSKSVEQSTSLPAASAKQAAPPETAPVAPTSQQPAATVSSTSSESAATSPASSMPATNSSGLRLEISATEKCWISVDRDKNPIFRKLMLPGEVQVFSAAEKFRIVLGNAGGVQMKVNGRPAKPLGKSGEVIKVFIDEKNLQDILDQNAG
jgi:cytoskeleton protein RodZ